MVLLAVCLSGCSLREAGFRVVANGRIFSVATLQDDKERYLEVDALREILTRLGATVDVNGADNVMAIAFPAGDEHPVDWPDSRADASYTIVFNEQILHAPFLDDEGRPYLSFSAFRSLCVAMKRRVSAPPYDTMLSIAPPEGEAMPTLETQPGHAVQMPGKGGH